MKLSKAAVRNFRRLEDIEIEFDEKETIFVGPNNSGKTTATAVFRCFLGINGFKIHDFSMAKISEINAYNPDNETSKLPEIELDLWFHFDPAGIEFGRVFALLPNLSESLDHLGIRCCYRVKKAEELWMAYDKVFPAKDEGDRKQALSHYLGVEGNLTHHFEMAYFSLEENEEVIRATLVDPKEGKRTLLSLLRVDFVDAQRKMDDEETVRSNKLSIAFASYYKGNHVRPELQEESVQIIDENNQRLTSHYEDSFQELFAIIEGLGVPSAKDRELKLVSSVSADTALKGSTDLMYVDTVSQHELPEAYNGLGFKNLVYMAVQVRQFQLQWINTKRNRPLCHLIAIEEPEVHLHAQAQQTFISNMWNVLNKASDEETLTPQLVITTHSSHVIDTVDFSKVRYFRRCLRTEDDPETQKILNATEVHDLKKFKPDPVTNGEETIPADEVLKFLKRYMTLTHCDLFFADGAVLIEGSVERILLRPMIEKCIPSLLSKYLSIIEVGGAYAHRFAGLLEFLNIPYLVLTDIDSVKMQDKKRPSACKTNAEGAVTSNGALKFFFKGKNAISELSILEDDSHVQKEGNRFISFQKPVSVNWQGKELTLHGRTLEDTFIYENLDTIKANDLVIRWQIPEDSASIQDNVYDFVNSSSFKKTEFALDVLASNHWIVPRYISRGLHWIAGELGVKDEPTSDI
jgi:putative ATP-dependent endonuclease of the OLD family